MITEIPKFKIGDEIQTNDNYRKMAEEHNSLPLGTKYPLEIKTKVIDVKVQDIHRTEYNERGFARMYHEIVRQIVVIKFDESGYWSQNYFDKIEE